MTKPSLLVLTSTFPRWAGDSEPPFVYELSQRLASNFRVTVLAPRAPGTAEREDLAGMSVIRYPYCLRPLEQLAYGGGILGNIRSKPWRLLLAPLLILGLWRAIRLALREQSVDVVHAHWLFPQAWVASLVIRGRRPALVATSHGADLFALRGWFWNRVRQRVLRRAAAVTVVGVAMADALKQQDDPTQNLQVVPMGVDLRGAFVPNPAVTRKVSQLLFVGRLVPKKGGDLLLYALSILGRRDLRPQLLVAGDGTERDALERLSLRLGLAAQVEFLGSIPNSRLPVLFHEATALVAPFVVAPDGDREGLGLVVVEAMGCGCPVVTTPVAEINEVVREGITAWVARSPSPESLADSIEAALSQPEEALARAQRARQQVLPSFDWEAIVDRYRAILDVAKGEVGKT